MKKNVIPQRNLKEKLKTAKGRKIASTRWLKRQLNDPYVKEAQNKGYRSRAAFKLIEIDQKYHIIKNGDKIIDLGAAPGGWSQVIAQKIKHNGMLIALDKQPIKPIENTIIIIEDFLNQTANQKIHDILKGKVNLILSDMVENTTGHRYTDHLKSMEICSAVFEFASQTLENNGTLLIKTLKGATDQELVKKMKKKFQKIKYIKPNASRPESTEIYILATKFKT